MTSRKSKVVLLILPLWLLAIGYGFRGILAYENSPGTSATAPAAWPKDSTIIRQAALPTLLMFVHPRCPCSRASVNELEVLMTRGQGLVRAVVVFTRPLEVPEGWDKTDLWTTAGNIPGVNLIVDNGAEEAKRFGSQTSGQVMLYSANGELLFKGGITSSRGHNGDNDGLQAILRMLTKDHSPLTETEVFGCPLFEKSPTSNLEDSCHANQY